MIKVQQQKIHEPGVVQGDCFSAVLASLLHLELKDIPVFEGRDWVQQVNAFLKPHGLGYLVCDTNVLVDCNVEDCWHEIAGPSPRFMGTVDHAVVGHDGVCVWDPHPSQAGLAHNREHGIFVLLQPWALSEARYENAMLKAQIQVLRHELLKSESRIRSLEAQIDIDIESSF